MSEEQGFNERPHLQGGVSLMPYKGLLLAEPQGSW